MGGGSLPDKELKSQKTLRVCAVVESTLNTLNRFFGSSDLVERTPAVLYVSYCQIMFIILYDDIQYII